MSAQARALVLSGPGVLQDTALPIPSTGTDDGILRIEACGLCGTDHEQFSGLLPGPGPFVPGHEIVGTIEAIGDEAAARWQVAAGDRVAVEVFQSCRGCPACLAGDYRRCHTHGMADMYGFVALDRPPGLWGGYATHLYLAPDAMVLPVPAGLDPVVATMFNPLGAGLRWGVSVPGTGPGSVVAVLGPGVRGLSAAAAAKEAGAAFVVVVGKGEGDRVRLELAGRFGADLVVDGARADPVRALLRATGRLADVVVDVTASAPEALGTAVDLVADGGTVVVAGTRGDGELKGFRPDLLVYKEARMVGALGVDAPSYRDALALLVEGTYPFESLPRRCVGLDSDAVAALLRTMSGADAAGGAIRPVHAVITP